MNTLPLEDQVKMNAIILDMLLDIRSTQLSMIAHMSSGTPISFGMDAIPFAQSSISYRDIILKNINERYGDLPSDISDLLKIK